MAKKHEKYSYTMRLALNENPGKGKHVNDLLRSCVNFDEEDGSKKSMTFEQLAQKAIENHTKWLADILRAFNMKTCAIDYGSGRFTLVLPIGDQLPSLKNLHKIAWLGVSTIVAPANSEKNASSRETKYAVVMPSDLVTDHLWELEQDEPGQEMRLYFYVKKNALNGLHDKPWHSSRNHVYRIRNLAAGSLERDMASEQLLGQKTTATEAQVATSEKTSNVEDEQQKKAPKKREHPGKKDEKSKNDPPKKRGRPSKKEEDSEQEPPKKKRRGTTHAHSVGSPPGGKGRNTQEGGSGSKGSGETSHESEAEAEVVEKPTQKTSKKPLSAFELFCQDKRSEFEKLYHTKNSDEITSLLVTRYRTKTTSFEKAEYEERAAKLQDRDPDEGDDTDVEVSKVQEVAKEKKGTAPKKARKDPNAPRRAKSAYLFFGDATRTELKEENPEATFGDIGKLLGIRWQNLAPDEKASFEAMAAKDKARYDKEMQSYKPPEGSTSTTARVQDSSKPKSGRVASPYIFFCNDHRNSVKEKNPDLDIKEVTQKLGKMWNALTKEEKQVYIDQREEEKARRMAKKMDESKEDASATESGADEDGEKKPPASEKTPGSGKKSDSKNGNSRQEDLLYEGAPPEKLDGGWPDGWFKRVFQRQTGATKGSKDSYWFSPGGRKFRSMNEVKSYLESMEDCDEDEQQAWKAYLAKKKMGNKKKNSQQGADTSPKPAPKSPSEVTSPGKKKKRKRNSEQQPGSPSPRKRGGRQKGSSPKPAPGEKGDSYVMEC